MSYHVPKLKIDQSEAYIKVLETADPISIKRKSYDKKNNIDKSVDWQPINLPDKSNHPYKPSY
jgi:hypothetical protein